MSPMKPTGNGGFFVLKNVNNNMSKKLDSVYESSVFGKPSIHLDALEQPKASGQQVISERETVINTYLPSRFHTKKGQPQQKSSGSLREKYTAKSGPDVEKQFISFLESYFTANRHIQLESVEHVMEDMYSFLKENQ